MAPFNSSVEFCAGSADGSRGSCISDLGGPLICIDENNHPVLYGLTSREPDHDCLNPSSPGVYAKVSSAIDWIQNTISSLVMKINFS